MPVTRTTPSPGRMLALLAGTAGLGFGSIVLPQHQGHEPLERPARVRAVVERTVLSATTRPVSKPKAKPHTSAVAGRRPRLRRTAAAPKHRDVPSSTAPLPSPAPAVAQTPPAAPASAPTLQAPVQAPAPAIQVPAPAIQVPATPAPTAVVSGGS